MRVQTKFGVGIEDQLTIQPNPAGNLDLQQTQPLPRLRPNKHKLQKTIKKIVESMKTTDLLPVSAKPLKRQDRSHAVLLATNYGGSEFRKLARKNMSKERASLPVAVQ